MNPTSARAVALVSPGRAFRTRGAELAATLLPAPAIEHALGRAMRGLETALCLHRISASRRPTDPLPWLSFPPASLDAFLALVAGRVRLTLTFDDGYADAVRAVARLAPLHPDVHFVVFVCPEKIERRAGFRWDLYETRRAAGETTERLLDFLGRDLLVERENRRADLLALGDAPQFRLATVDEVRALRRLPNVRIGNHGNTHFRLASLAAEAARTELERSATDFERLFGRTEDFAFPFGVPGRDFDGSHVAILRSLGIRRMWSTQARAFRHGELVAGGVLPRVPVMGTWHPKVLAMRVALSTRAVWR